MLLANSCWATYVAVGVVSDDIIPPYLSCPHSPRLGILESGKLLQLRDKVEDLTMLGLYRWRIG